VVSNDDDDDDDIRKANDNDDHQPRYLSVYQQALRFASIQFQGTTYM